MLRTSVNDNDLEYSKKNYVFITLIVLFMLGMIYGALIVKSQSEQVISQLSIFTQGFAYANASKNFTAILTTSFFSGMIFLVVPYLLGYSAIGQIGSILVPLFKGLGLGLAMGYLYGTYGITGVLYSLLIIIPQTIIMLFAIFIACRESIKLSNLFLKSVKFGGIITLETIKLYSFKFVILSIMVFLGAIIEGLSATFFSKMFNI